LLKALGNGTSATLMVIDNIFKIIGGFFFFVGFVFIGLIYAPVFKEEVRYQTSLLQSGPKKEIVPQSTEFGLVIPKIGVNAEVFANVDADNPKEYLPLLTKGVAHAKGSVLPGGEGNVFIFAHSSDTPTNITRYNAVFYLLSKLEPEDEIIIYFSERKYLYKVIEKKTIPPEVLDSTLRSLKGKTLTLQTCTPPGTTINRLLVIAEEVD
jgi:LPXTG-site transpeptidase (sortase) family protein